MLTAIQRVVSMNIWQRCWLLFQTLTYSWDRGGRLLSAGGSSYAYNGLGTPDHPFGMYVGDFTALEKAGIGKPFHIYSFWEQVNVYSVFVPCPSNCNCPIDASNATYNHQCFIACSKPHNYNPLSTGEIGDLEQDGYPVSRFFEHDIRPY